MKLTSGSETGKRSCKSRKSRRVNLTNWWLLLSLRVLTLHSCLTGSTIGATRIVPDNHATIQAAIDSAASGDTVLVRAGTYYENLLTQGKALTLKGLDGPESTVIDGNHQGSVVLVTGNAWIEGFTIQNGQNDHGGGIYVQGQSSSRLTVTIRGNLITKNRAGYVADSGNGGGILLKESISSMISSNSFVENYSGNSGGGVYVDGGSFSGLNKIEGNIFSENACHVGGGAIEGNRAVCISDNLIVGNRSDSFGGGIDGSAATISNNTILYNYINNSLAALGAGIHIAYGTPTIERNIVAFNYGVPGSETGVGILCESNDGPSILRCNDSWGNDWEYRILGDCDTTGLGNLSADPMFCDISASDFQIQAASPCAPEHSGCGLIGRYPVGCNSVSVRTVTWGILKALFGRRPEGGQR